MLTDVACVGRNMLFFHSVSHGPRTTGGPAYRDLADCIAAYLRHAGRGSGIDVDQMRVRYKPGQHERHRRVRIGKRGTEAPLRQHPL